MADKEIGTLTAASKLTGSETIHGVQGGNSRRMTSQEISDIGSNIVTDATTARILAIGDASKWIRFTSASSITCTINTGIFGAGDEIAFEQAGAGVITYTAGAGFTLRSAGSLILSNGQYTTQALKFISATEALLFGNIA